MQLFVRYVSVTNLRYKELSLHGFVFYRTERHHVLNLCGLLANKKHINSFFNGGGRSYVYRVSTLLGGGD